MKKFIYFIISVSLVLSCSDLNLIPLSQKSIEGFYQSEVHIEQATIGIYNGLREAWVNSNFSYGLTESRSDNTFQFFDAYDDGAISKFTDNASLSDLNTAWSRYYSYINRCNRILESLSEIEMDASIKNQFEGEARFGRALFYFDLVRYFGGVPIVTSTLTINEGYDVARATEKEVYEIIVQDLVEAEKLLPSSYDSENKGRATKWSAKGYLGKVYMFMSGYPLNENKYEDAIQIFKEIIDSDLFEFFESYEDIFLHENEGGPQQLFSIQFKAGAEGNGNRFPTRNGPNEISPIPIEEGGLPFGGSGRNLFLSENLLESFEENDIRKDVSIRIAWMHKSGDIITNEPFCQKYQNGPVSGSYDWDIDWIALRYCDVLLMYAEALNEVEGPSGDALEILNMVRERAGLASKNTTSSDVFRGWMEEERRHEFCFENIRWFDLVRTDRALEVMKSFLSEYGLESNIKGREQYIYPIPQAVLDISPVIKQNAGY